MNKTNDRTDQILREVIIISGALTSLTRTVDRIDERLSGVEGRTSGIEGRLVNIEKQTSLIPGMVKAIRAFADDLNDHERRIKRLESSAA